MSGRGSGKPPGRRGTLIPHAGYAVGYGKPPASGRFRPGQSGNPKGRPRGSKNRRPGLHEERLKGIILDEAYRGITVLDGNRTVTVPMAQAVIRALAVNAAKGQHRAQRLFAELLVRTETANRILHDQWLETAITYKADWERELRRRETFGITDLPPPLPHPDHVRIDFGSDTARIVGPMTREEKAQWDLWLSRKADFENELAELQEMLARKTDAGMRQILTEDIAETRKVLSLIDRALGMNSE